MLFLGNSMFQLKLELLGLGCNFSLKVAYNFVLISASTKGTFSTSCQLLYLWIFEHQKLLFLAIFYLRAKQLSYAYKKNDVGHLESCISLNFAKTFLI